MLRVASSSPTVSLTSNNLRDKKSRSSPLSESLLQLHPPHPSTTKHPQQRHNQEGGGGGENREPTLFTSGPPSDLKFCVSA